MLWRVVLVTTLLVTVDLAAVASAADGPDTIVVTKRFGITIGKDVNSKAITKDAAGKPITAVTLQSPYYRVLGKDDKQGFKILENGNQVWLPLTDGVPLDTAVTEFAQLVKSSSDAFTWGRLALAYQLQGDNFKASGDKENANRNYTLAIQHYGTAIRLAPTSPALLNNRGRCYYQRSNGGDDDLKQAIANYDAALDFDPKFVLAFTNRGLCWEAKHCYEEARRDYENAINADGNDPAGRNAYAWMLVKRPNPDPREFQHAIDLATTACQKSGNTNGSHLDTLAAAYFSRGNYSGAIKWEQVALTDPTLTDKAKLCYQTQLIVYIVVDVISKLKFMVL